MAVPLEILLAFLMTAIGGFGALCFKRLTSNSKRLTIKSLLISKMLYLGGFLYVLASVFNVILLKHIDYSIVYPLSAMTYIWTLFISRFVLHEKINAFKITAVVLIICGVTVINL
jgi:drug/metabolite transporter (DMT)-like permease